MGAIVADMSVSRDRFVTGPDPDLEHGLGRGGEPLHDWWCRSWLSKPSRSLRMPRT